MQPISQGKVKDVFEDEEKTLLFDFSDRISVFDKIIPSLIPRKGESLCRTSAFWFEKLKEIGIKSHFVRLDSPKRMIVKRVDIIRDYDKIDSTTKNYLIPLEVICRHYVAGSLFDRISKGKGSAAELGFSDGETAGYGAKLPKPMVEFTTKLEPVDRLLTEEEALRISGLTPEELEDLKNVVLKIDELIAITAAKHGLIHVDGKKEFAFDENRDIMVIDGFGTLDEDRWWEADATKCSDPEGDCKVKECSKEFVRQYYRKIGYFKELEDVRATGIPEPDIPALPENVIKEVSDMYVRMFERITGEKF